MRRLVVLLALVAAGVGAAVAAAATPKPAVQVDAKGDVGDSPLDLRQFVLARGSDGRFRISMTMASTWDSDDLLSEDGPPGSLCVKLWTASEPPDQTPDYLVCVTSGSDGDLRGSILKERANQLPQRTASASVTRPSERTVTLRFSQSALGKPAVVRGQAEATRAGCTRGSCIDLAPDAPKVLTLKLREETK